MALKKNSMRRARRITPVTMCTFAVTASLIASAGGMASASAQPLTSTAKVAAAATTVDERPRMILTQDGEVDDMDSFIRWLYYSNEFDTEGIIYSSSTYHYSGNGADVEPFRWTGTEWVNEYIDRYEEIYPNLRKHAEGYPSPSKLRSLYKIGNITNVSEMTQVTEGSEWIKNVILDADPRPVYVQAWGGLNTVARALKSIEEQYSGTAEWAAIQQKINSKVIIYNILNQDTTLNGYIKPNWPGVKIIDNQSAFWAFAYAWPGRVPTPTQYVLRADWMEQNLLDGTGPLMNEYRTYRDGNPTEGDDQNNRWRPEVSQANQNVGYGVHDFISEGDSPAYMYLFDFNGLRSAENPTWGGWGGRFEPNASGWVDTQDENPYSTTTTNRRSYPLTRWVEDIQQDFAARVTWGMSDDYEEANHNPTSSVTQGLDLSRKAGAVVHLDGVTGDPDGDAVTTKWWQYTDADTYPGKVTIEGADTNSASFTVPADAQPGQTIHLIMESSDDGSPALTHYQRVVVTVVANYDAQVASTVALTVDEGSQRYAAKKPATASVQVAIADRTVADGTVALFDGDQQVGANAKVDSSGTASVTLPSTLATGSHSLVARFTPTEADRLAGSASSVVPFQVKKATSTTKLTLKRAKGVAKIAVKVSGVTPTGKVKLFHGDKVVATVKLTKSDEGRESVRVRKLDSWKGSLTAKYTGNENIGSDRSKVVKVRKR